MLVLRLLVDEDGYGYALVERLRGAGLDGLAEGTVYPALSRLEKRGWLTSYLQPSSSGPARKYYAVTEAGRDELVRQRRAWAALVVSVDAVLGRPIDPEDLGDVLGDEGIEEKAS